MSDDGTSIRAEARRKLAEARATTFAPKGSHPVREEIDLLDGRWYATTHHEDLAWMRSAAPVYHDPNSDVWAVTRYDDIREVSTDPGTFSSYHGIRPKTGHLPMMISFDDPEHRTRRGLVSTGFTPRRVAEREESIRALCHDLVDDVIADGRCDWVGDVAAWLPLIVIGDMLGIAREDRGKLLEWSDQLLKSTTGDLEDQDEATAAFEEYVVYQSAIIEDRRQNPQDDLVSTLIEAEIDGERLSDDDLLYESLLILIGGDETTRHVLSGGMLQLIRHPGALAAIRRDPGLIPTAVEEMLRWVSPIKSMSRTTTRDVELGGETIPAGDELLLMYASANRDEAHFEAPFTFDIHREPNRHLAFGQGPHFCLGASLARLELKCMFEVVAERLHDLELAVDEDDLEWRPSSFISGLERLPITFTPDEPTG